MADGNDAEVLALRALEWMSIEKEPMRRFMATSGATLEDVRALVSDPEFLGSVLDFLLTEDRYVAQFCDSVHLPRADLAKARTVLPGGDLPNWT